MKARTATLQNHFHFRPVYIWKPLTPRIKQIPFYGKQVHYESVLAYSHHFPIYPRHSGSTIHPSSTRVASFMPLAFMNTISS